MFMIFSNRKSPNYSLISNIIWCQIKYRRYRNLKILNKLGEKIILGGDFNIKNP